MDMQKCTATLENYITGLNIWGQFWFLKKPILDKVNPIIATAICAEVTCLLW